MSKKYNLTFTGGCILAANDTKDRAKYPWITVCDIIVMIDGVKLVIPKGFHTDLASSGPAKGLCDTNGIENLAPILHDFLYAAEIFPRNISDLLFRDALDVLGADKWKIPVMYQAVNLFGWIGYKEAHSLNRITVIRGLAGINTDDIKRPCWLKISDIKQEFSV